MNAKKSLALAIATALIVLVVVALCWQPALAQRGGSGGSGTSPRYSVIDTEGHNLIVTDNQSNTLYFYTIDKDAKIGSDMKLRGSLDLTQVGKPVIKITKAEVEK